MHCLLLVGHRSRRGIHGESGLRRGLWFLCALVGRRVYACVCVLGGAHVRKEALFRELAGGERGNWCKQMIRREWPIDRNTNGIHVHSRQAVKEAPSADTESAVIEQ